MTIIVITYGNRYFVNIAELINDQVKAFPHKAAVVMPKRVKSSYLYDQLTFTEFQSRSLKYSQGFQDNGITKGMKVLMFVSPSIDFSVITFSLFQIGAVPIFIDPGMGRKNLLKAIKSIQPEAMIAIPKVHFLRKFFPKVFNSLKFSFTTGAHSSNAKSILPWRNVPLKTGLLKDVLINDNDLAAILFTSGGTGTPKGVEYSHHIFAKQTNMLQELFDLKPTEIDLPGFPLFSLFTISMGMTSVIPDMDPSKPAKVNPKKIIQNIIDKKTTFIAGSPAIWDKVGQYCIKKNIKLPTVKYLVMFGAPVSPKIHKMWKNILVNGTTYTPYGATECLPITCISGTQLEGYKTKENIAGAGTCVGKPVQNVNIKIIHQSDNVIESINDTHDTEKYEIGEIIVQSEVATRSYFNLPSQTKMAKIKDNENFWHRMGDLGYFDEEGNIWFCGRCSHKVMIAGEIHSPIQSEAIFNNDPQVKRSALIPYGEFSAIVIEPQSLLKSYRLFNHSFKNHLLKLAIQHSKTNHIKKIFFKKEFPVDIRHNIKIDRIKLKKEFQDRPRKVQNDHR
jgi:olefin beta-lactone synthetase